MLSHRDVLLVNFYRGSASTKCSLEVIKCSTKYYYDGKKQYVVNRELFKVEIEQIRRSLKIFSWNSNEMYVCMVSDFTTPNGINVLQMYDNLRHFLFTAALLLLPLFFFLSLNCIHSWSDIYLDNIWIFSYINLYKFFFNL